MLRELLPSSRRRLTVALLLVATSAHCSPTLHAVETAPGQIRPLREVVFPRTAAALARGRYLAEGVLQCFICHSERDWLTHGAPPKAGFKGAGRILSRSSERLMVAPNITPDRETGGGSWSDDMYARAIREGVGHDGRPLSAAMWWNSFKHLSDEDVAAVVAYVRSIPAIRHSLPKRRLPAAEERALARTPQPILKRQPSPDLTDAVRRGRYLARLADCAGCHSAWEAPTNPGVYGGGNDTASERNHVFTTNLTPDPSGIPYYDEALFIEVMRTGKVKARVLDPAMRWIAFRNMDDRDLAAIFAFLKTLPPVRHNVSNLEPPSLCPACGQRHGFGDRNPSPEARRASVDVALLRPLVGKYRFRDGYVFEIRLEGSRLTLEGADAPRSELMPISPTAFINLGSQAGTFSFERDAKNRVAALILQLGDEDDRAVKIE